MKYGVSSRNMKLFRTMFKNTPLSAQQQINAKLMEERENQTKRFNKTFKHTLRNIGKRGIIYDI